MPPRRATATSGRTGPRTSRAADSSATRERILAAAERLFAEQGYDTVTMPAIAEACNITAGAIYWHFPGKADLFFEVMRRSLDATPALKNEAPLDVATWPDMIASYTARPLKRVRQLGAEAHYASAKHPKVRRLLKRTNDTGMRRNAELIAAAQSAGRLNSTRDPDLLAAAVMVQIMGLVHMETLIPHLVGDERWRKFVSDQVAALLGLPARPN